MDNQKIISAIYTAACSHDDQLDRKGMPYILHPMRVGSMGKDENEIIVGLLHDTLEDTSLTYNVIEFRFGKTVADAVQALTRPKEEHDYLEHIREHVAKNPIAVRVKINDLKDNMGLYRNTDGRARVIPKYVLALEYLEQLVAEDDQQVQGVAPLAALASPSAPLSGEIGSAALPDSVCICPRTKQYMGEFEKTTSDDCVFHGRFRKTALELKYPPRNGSMESLYD